MNRGNLGYYNRVMKTKFVIGYDVNVPIELVPKSLKMDVDVMCDICGEKSVVTYRNYNECLGYGFYTCNSCKHVKRKMTNKSKYGIENFQNSEKSMKTHIKKYGFFNNNRNKSKDTCLNKYGFDNVSKADSIKKKKIETNIRNWGVENVFQSEVIKDRNKKTLMSNFGVDHPSKSPELFQKAQISGFKVKLYNGIYYRGTYELNFLKFCESNELKVENGPSIKFNYNGNTKVYYPDFYLSEYNLICEVKSDYTYIANKEINDIKKIETEKQGYNFIFIINKNYEDLLKFII